MVYNRCRSYAVEHLPDTPNEGLQTEWFLHQFVCSLEIIEASGNSGNDHDTNW